MAKLLSRRAQERGSKDFKMRTYPACSDGTAHPESRGFEAFPKVNANNKRRRRGFGGGGLYWLPIDLARRCVTTTSIATDDVISTGSGHSATRREYRPRLAVAEDEDGRRYQSRLFFANAAPPRAVSLPSKVPIRLRSGFRATRRSSSVGYARRGYEENSSGFNDDVGDGLGTGSPDSATGGGRFRG